jgi:hypothetical protein
MIAFLGLNIGGAITSVLKDTAGFALSAIAKAFLGAVQMVLVWLWKAIGNSTAVALGGPAFDRLFAVVGVIAAVVIFMLFTIEVGMSALRHDAGGMMRALRGVVIATLGTILAIFAINELLAVTDAASNGIIEGTTGEKLGTFGVGIMSYTAISSLGNPMLIILMSFVVMVASFMIWFSLILRKILIILAAIFAPLAFSGAVAGFSTNWLRKWIEGTVAMIVSKLFLAIILVTGYYTFLYGVGNTSAGGVTSVAQAMGSATAGTMILALAALAPWLAIKSVHFASDHMSVAAGHASTMTAGVQKVRQHGQAAMSLASGLGAGGAAGAAAGGAASTGPTGPPGPGSTPPPVADPPPSTSPTSAGSALWDQVAANGYTVPKPASDAETAAATRAGTKLWDEVIAKQKGTQP